MHKLLALMIFSLLFALPLQAQDDEDISIPDFDATFSSESDVLTVNYPSAWEANIDPNTPLTSLIIESSDYSIDIFMFTWNLTSAAIGITRDASLSENVQAFSQGDLGPDFDLRDAQTVNDRIYQEKSGVYENRFVALGIMPINADYVVLIQARSLNTDVSFDEFQAWHAIGLAVLDTLVIDVSALEGPTFDPDMSGNTDVAIYADLETVTNGNISITYPTNSNLESGLAFEDFEVMFPDGEIVLFAESFNDPDEPHYTLEIENETFEIMGIEATDGPSALEEIRTIFVDSIMSEGSEMTFLSGMLAFDSRSYNYVELLFTMTDLDDEDGADTIEYFSIGVLSLDEETRYFVIGIMERGELVEDYGLTPEEAFYEFHAVGRSIVIQFAEQAGRDDAENPATNTPLPSPTAPTPIILPPGGDVRPATIPPTSTRAPSLTPRPSATWTLVPSTTPLPPPSDTPAANPGA